MVLTYAQIDSCKAILRERIQELQAEAIGDRAPLGRAMLERSEDARAMWRVLDWLETIHLRRAANNRQRLFSRRCHKDRNTFPRLKVEGKREGRLTKRLPCRARQGPVREYREVKDEHTRSNRRLLSSGFVEGCLEE